VGSHIRRISSRLLLRHDIPEGDFRRQQAVRCTDSGSAIGAGGCETVVEFSEGVRMERCQVMRDVVDERLGCGLDKGMRQ